MAGDGWLILSPHAGLNGESWLAGESDVVVSQHRVTAETGSAVQTTASTMPPVQAERRAARAESQRPRRFKTSQRLIRDKAKKKNH